MSEANTLIAHLVELRSRILKALLSVMLVFVCLVYFAQDLYHILATPLLEAMPENSQMIATDVASPFFAPFKLNDGVVVLYRHTRGALSNLGICCSGLVSQ